MNALAQANREAQQRLDEWNRFMDKALDGTGIVDPGERQMKLDAWMLAEQKANNLRRMAGNDGQVLS